jgi:predicted kinase
MTRLIVVTGPPCAGKTTYTTIHKYATDAVIDLDALAHALGYPGTHIHPDDRGHLAAALAQRARASVIKAALEHRPGGGAVFLIDTEGTHADQADTLVRLDPGQDACHERARHAGRARATHDEIDRWYARHGRPKT